MPGGRPARPGAQPQPELAEIAGWFRTALADAGYASVNAFVQRHPFDKNQVYGFVNGTRFLTLESCRGLAVALGREAGEVDPLWWRAKQAVERQAAADRSRETVPTSWDALPWPSAALQDILQAQVQAVDMLPYHLLGVEPPPLSAVYVRQHARTQPGATKPDRKEARPESQDRDRADSTGGEKPIPITDALDRHEHLVVTGEPGAGKSTFGQYLALQLCHLWLREWNGDRPPISEPVVPLRIPARTLVGARSWTAGLAGATQAALGLRLVAEPPAALFERRPAGIRWLVIVDGLDEIVDRAARTEVIQALAARCRPGGDYRIVVTTRQLPEVEFAPLRTQHVETYSVEPFGRDELRMFATQWFRAQGAGDPDRDAERFLRQTADGRLRDLVRNPLLATIAAITYTLQPDRPLPASRLDLYQRFFEHLLDGRDTAAELRRSNAHRPSRARFAAWIHENRLDMLRHLGVARLESESPLLDAALAWVGEKSPPGIPRPVGWTEDVREVLLGTGLILYEGDRLRFLSLLRRIPGLRGARPPYRSGFPRSGGVDRQGSATRRTRVRPLRPRAVVPRSGKRCLARHRPSASRPSPACPSRRSVARRTRRRRRDRIPGERSRKALRSGVLPRGPRGAVRVPGSHRGGRDPDRRGRRGAGCPRRIRR
ncbi:hypothetical protein [Actinoplanes sp. NPDC051851]|uniref:NACHT domain-containing protein n=1 Tax=Actinoplanes sp. NPDC051851 TaxID=3154753 RepID=UPI00343D7782